MLGRISQVLQRIWRKILMILLKNLVWRGAEVRIVKSLDHQFVRYSWFIRPFLIDPVVSNKEKIFEILFPRKDNEVFSGKGL
jgi:hypothetical protein